MDYRLRAVIKRFFREQSRVLKTRRRLVEYFIRHLKMVPDEADEIITALLESKHLSESAVNAHDGDGHLRPESVLSPGPALGSAVFPGFRTIV
jgi:hypothetical protein